MMRGRFCPMTEAEACWRTVTADVLLVAGSASEFAGGANAIDGVDSLGLTFDQATLEVIDEAGHMLHYDAPAAVAAAIERFFAAHL